MCEKGLTGDGGCPLNSRNYGSEGRDLDSLNRLPLMAWKGVKVVLKGQVVREAAMRGDQGIIQRGKR